MNSMKIQVKFFASLREQVGIESATVDVGPGATAAEVWREAAGERPMPENLLVAVNMDYSSLDHAVGEGDEVAFFPPVTGGAQ
jgi:molybdopterin synthase sulfur carrier subunit